MENKRYSVLLADDENIVRNGLHYVIDWEDLDFYICEEAAAGTEALEKIRRFQPDLVLLDIRMPGMYGTELIQKAREEGFNGEFIILSGYSDFSYAQTALKYGASSYLTKPIDEDELENAVKAVKDKLETKNRQSTSLKNYRTKAKSAVLLDLITGKEIDPAFDYREIGIDAPIYQVVIYENYSPYFQSYNFAELLRVTNQNNNTFETIHIDNRNCILLKGSHAMNRFDTVLKHYQNGTEKGSPLDSIFLVYGREVTRPEDIYLSYNDCLDLLERRFFCDPNQHVLSYASIPAVASETVFENADTTRYGDAFSDYIKTGNQAKIQHLLDELKNELFTCDLTSAEIKVHLIDIFLQVKHQVMHTYYNTQIPLMHNQQILEFIESRSYLYEILQFFEEQFTMIIMTVGTDSGEGTFDSILQYIDTNYDQPLKLETLAGLFGYNRSYLGRLFTQKTGISFNTYLDQTRVRQAAVLLKDTDEKVYEISSKVGYRSVDYFHQKFKKIMDMSPAEYRKMYRDS